MHSRLGMLGWIFVALGLVQLWKVQDSFKKDIYWTPTTAHEQLAAGAGKFEIYARGRPLNQVVAAGDLGMRSGDSWSAIQPAELSLRLNHIDDVTRTPLVAGIGFSAFGLAWLLATFAQARRSQPR